MRPAIVFDDHLGQLSPMTDLRPVFDIRTGALTTLERLTEELGLDVRALFVPDAIAPLARAAHPGVQINTVPDTTEPLLCVNGRMVIPTEQVISLPLNARLIEKESGALIAAYVPPKAARQVITERKTDSGEVIEVSGQVLLSRPWHIRRFRDRAISADLDLLDDHETPAPPGVTHFGDAPLAIDASARLFPSVVLDCEKGPIVIAAHAVVRPGAVLVGPVYVGEHAFVAERAVLKAHTVVGPWCKVGGEIGGTIFQSHSNKVHDGHLGDSWIGQWVNLGAGTTNSNLLNTYSEVKARPSVTGATERTGEQFLGCVMGDHVKTAICTRLMTGVIVGTCTMAACSEALEGTIRGFDWITDAGRRTYRLDRLLTVVKSVMGRRGITPDDAYIERIKSLHHSAMHVHA